MEAMEPSIHSNKRYRSAPDIAAYPASAGGPQLYTAQPVAHSNQRTGSDQSSGSDHRSGSEPAGGSMSRSVSDSSLALSVPDSRTGVLQPYGVNGPMPNSPYPSPDVANHMLLHNGVNAQLANGPVQASSNMAAYQGNHQNVAPSINAAFLMHNTHIPMMNGCLPQHSVPLSGNNSALPPSAPVPIITNFMPAPNGLVPGANGIIPSSGMFHQNGPLPNAPQQGFRNPDSSSQGSTGVHSLPNPPSVPKWDANNPPPAPTPSTSTSTVQLEPPCAACKSLRRKCTRDCIFLPYFPRDDPEKFARVHKVFGASNVAKMLQDLPVHQREDTVASLEYEAQARVQDPVFGCVGILCLLQKQIAMLQNQVAELQRQQGIGGQGQGMATRTPLQEGQQGASVGAPLVPHQGSMQGGSVLAPLN